MTERIYVSVYAAGIDKSYEFAVPANMCVENAVSLITKIISDEYGTGAEAKKNKPALIRRSDGAMLNASLSLSQLGIANGERLILI